MIALRDGDARGRPGGRTRRRHRVVHLATASGAAADAGLGARGARRAARIVLSARPVFEPHPRRDACVSAAATTRSRATSATHPHAIHGVGWQRAWSIDAATPIARAGARARPARRRRGAWPWPFRATQTFELAAVPHGARCCRTTLTLDNTGAQPFPFGLGWHPFFPRPTPRRPLRFAARRRVAATTRRSCRCSDRRAGGVAVPPPPAARRPRRSTTCSPAGSGAPTSRSRDRRPRRRSTADRACGCLVVYAPPRARLHRARAGHARDRRVQSRAAGATRRGFRTLAPGARLFLYDAHCRVARRLTALPLTRR